MFYTLSENEFERIIPEYLNEVHNTDPNNIYYSSRFINTFAKT